MDLTIELCDVVISSVVKPEPWCVSFDLCALYSVMFGQCRVLERCEFCRLVISFLAVVCLSSPPPLIRTDIFTSWKLVILGSGPVFTMWICGGKNPHVPGMMSVPALDSDTRSARLQLMSFSQGSFDSNVIVVSWTGGPGVIIECANGEL